MCGGLHGLIRVCCNHFKYPATPFKLPSKWRQELVGIGPWVELFVNFITPRWVGAYTQHTHTYTCTYAHRKTTTKNVENCLSKMWPGRGSVGQHWVWGWMLDAHTDTHKYTQAHYINLHAFIAAQRERNKQTNNSHTHTHTHSLFKDLHTHTHVYISVDACFMQPLRHFVCTLVKHLYLPRRGRWRRWTPPAIWGNDLIATQLPRLQP